MSVEGGHWYTRDGKPCHTQPTKSPGAKNPTRGTNIADAKEQKLLPSVSGVTGVMANPALDYWKQEAVGLAAYNCPAIGTEDKEAYARKLINLSKKEGNAAAALGTEVHDILEYMNYEPHRTVTFPTTGEVVPAVDIQRWVQGAVAPLAITPRERECITVNRAEGYAGTTDMAFVQGERHGILDYKSIKTKKGEPIKRRESHPMQIAAYIAAYWGKESLTPINEKSVGYNVYISTTEPGRVEVREYSYAELLAAWEAFRACLTLWRYKSGYDPREGGANV